MNHSNEGTKNPNKAPTKKRGGFTMVELIVVIVIILVLAAVLVPSLLKYIAKSQEAVCRSNRATLYTEICSAYAIGDYDSLTEAFTDTYSKYSGKCCPQNGVYTFEPDTDEFGNVFSGKIICSVHDADGHSDTSGYDAGSYYKECTQFDVSSEKTLMDKDKALNKQFKEKYNGTLPPLSEKEKALFDNINGTNIRNPLSKEQRDSLTWEPRIASNGEMIMAARVRDAKNNWSTYMIYYKGNYYYHTNGYNIQNAASITDSGNFDVELLNDSYAPGKSCWVKANK